MRLCHCALLWAQSTEAQAKWESTDEEIGTGPALDLPLGHRVVRPAPRVSEPVLLEVGRQVLGDVAGTVVAEQARLVLDPDPIREPLGNRRPASSYRVPPD